MSDAEHIYNIADHLKRLTGRLQKLAVRATPVVDDKGAKGAKAARR
jgi:hypothetical protein